MPPSSDQTRPAPPGLLPRLLVAVLPVVAASVGGGLFTAPNIPTWYAGLAKPGFTPPNWVFPVVWTILYAMMALAIWRILGRRPATGPARRSWALAVAAFFVQLALNAAWPPVFFAGHDLLGGLVVVVALLLAVLWTTRLFLSLDRTAGLLLVPYAAWAAYASALTAAIWRMN
ncbi:TspO/MBR family protein [Methylobacterium oryzihabitans]|uniref:Tryptophan-rich sensory protein n=1 Tax=Methylobacterium oryzihabitans TaxID=2499852 RepID=A0A3S2YMW5_9HYPH|nr:TspO/MBR family protein [Methylobacterium oryzihabitans]RVU15193.1 tryptophan-rich sensory protein [Methylobacterium oryzihabitans]